MDIKQTTTSENIFYDWESKIYAFCDVFLMDSWVYGPLIIAVYLLFVLQIGPEFMKKRQPYKLNNVLIVYNIIQVAISCYIVAKATKYIWNYGIWHTKCQLYIEENYRRVLYLGYCYILAKFSELLDTVFFVLRKKQNQVTFLHVYHHVLMATGAFLTLKHDVNENEIFVGYINTFVHIIMYGYYCLSAIPGIEKYLWWKKYITKLQLIQFAFMLIHIGLCCKFSPCPPSTVTIYAIIFNAILFIYLFSKFYLNSYMKLERKNKSAGLKEETYNKKKNIEKEGTKNEMATFFIKKIRENYLTLFYKLSTKLR